MDINDLKWRGVRQFRTVPTGEFRTARNGRRVPLTMGEEYIDTVGSGQMTLEHWYQEMEKAVKQEDQTDLLEKIISYCRRLAWLKTEKAVREYALECLSSEAYKAWEDFKG